MNFFKVVGRAAMQTDTKMENQECLMNVIINNKI